MSFKFPSLQSISQSINETFDSSVKASQKFTNELTPFAKKTQRLIQEKLGNVEDVSELPEEYLLLEKKCDSLYKIFKKVVDVTNIYELESYDYPPNIKESISDYSKTISEKLQGLANATSTQEAEKILTSTSNKDQLPKTLYHAIAKAAIQSHEELIKIASNETNSSLSKALLLLSNSEKLIGNKRVKQDETINNDFNFKINSILNDSFRKTLADRKKVYNSRLSFDLLRQEIKFNPHKEVELNKELEAAEDELVNATELAVQSMKKLIEPVETINLIKILAKAQLEYFKSATSDLESLVNDLESLPVESIDEE